MTKDITDIIIHKDDCHTLPRVRNVRIVVIIENKIEKNHCR